MSIIIANNDETGFYIISDTKITFNEDKYPCQIQEPLKSNIKKFGILKTVIIRGCVTLSFAGNDIKHADKVVAAIRNKMYAPSVSTYESIYEIVNEAYNSKDNISSDGVHKCDYILAIVTHERIRLNVFKDNFSCEDVKKCYIGNSEVYKDYFDFNKPIPEPDCIARNEILIDNLNLNIKITPTGDVEQETDEMKCKMQQLKQIVDLGQKCDSKHETDVGSPIIGVYYNTQRKEFEYYLDKIYEVHRECPSDGKTYAINISANRSGESYDIIPFKYTEGVIIYNCLLDYSVAYLCSDEYIKQGIVDYNNLLLPIYFKGYIDETKFSPI